MLRRESIAAAIAAARLCDRGRGFSPQTIALQRESSDIVTLQVLMKTFTFRRTRGGTLFY
jgi:hypothetical protein